MSFPYLITTLLYTFVAILVAADASFVSWNLLATFPALRWIRVHFITLGIVSQVVFGLLPGMVASLAKKTKPVMRWDIWLTLNIGFVALIAGFSGVNHAMIFAGGSLIFVSVSLLLAHLWKLRGGNAPASLKFYIAGLFYLMVGIIIGTGLWLNWSDALYIKVPLEAHIHANSWGFMSLTFAGLFVDFIPLIAARALASERSIRAIFWSMTTGAFFLVLGPWLGGNMPIVVTGLILHLGSTLWLIYLVTRALKDSGRLATPGGWHLILAYVWILAPVLIAPLILTNVIAGGPVESTAPQPLIYGWVLQFSIALIPYIMRRSFLKEENPPLGGCWGSLFALALGGVLIWISIFLLAPAKGILYGAGFAFYALALIHPMKEIFEIAKTSLEKRETD
ncbi:MAG: hypothetical protein IT310_14130 [Anaerolineales bacterium]|nr:hypothetical protein [Anaerolineales bacterium]